MDYLLLRSTVGELSSRLEGRRITDVIQLSPWSLGLKLLGKSLLALSISSKRSGIFLLSQGWEDREKSHFCRFLQAQLKGAYISAVSQVPWERIVRFRFFKRSLVGKEETVELIAEVMGRYSNLILVDSDEHILEAMKHVYRDMSSVREVMPGRVYHLPPFHGRMDPLELEKAEFLRLLVKEETPEEALSKYSLFPSYAINELCFRAQPLVSGPLTLIRLWEALLTIKEEISQGKGYLYLKGSKQMVSPFPLHHQGAGVDGYRLLEALERSFRDGLRMECVEEKRRELLHPVKRELKRVDRRIRHVDEELLEVEGVERYRRWGETILIYLKEIKEIKGDMALFNIQDPFNPGEWLEIPLEKRYSPSQMAQRYFKRYSKGKRKAEVLKERREHALRRKNFLDALLWSIEEALEIEELTELESDLVKEGLLRHVKGKVRPLPTFHPYRLFITPFGTSILVGKHPRGNEVVTFKIADRGDYWFHVKGYPGAHVVLRSSSPWDEEIVMTASLAAYYSKARDSSWVEVDYARRKYVKKVPGGFPGLVIYSHQKSLRVVPSIPPQVSLQELDA